MKKMMAAIIALYLISSLSLIVLYVNRKPLQPDIIAINDIAMNISAQEEKMHH